MKAWDSREVPRIGGISFVDETRAQFDDSASAGDFREVAKRPRLAVLQCSAPVRDTVWALINELVAAPRPEVQLRVYGHYPTSCDLSFVRLLTNARRFAADCLQRATGVEAIAAIPHLESLSLGVFDLTDFSVLDRISTGLTSLSLHATRSKKPSLLSLSRFRSLRTLYLEGQSKDIAVLSELPDLEDVTLRSITTPDLGYLAHLPKLWSLDIKLGGIRNFAAIESKPSIKYLELWQVRDLSDVRVVGTLPGLQSLFLQSLPHVRSFPQLKNAAALRRVHIQNLKGLHDFTPFATAPALEEFVLVQGNTQAPEELMPVLANPSVRRVAAYFGSNRKNSEFAGLREKHGKAEERPREPFQYR
jgi:hypothetical protein